jgi:hypothetical protein
VVSVDQAFELLSDIRITINRSLSALVQKAKPFVTQVWYEPIGSTQPPQPVIALDGAMKYSPQTVGWTTRHTPEDLRKMFAQGAGRVLIRVHCWYLLDQKGKPVSSSPELIIASGLPPMPGGVFESWFWVKG